MGLQQVRLALLERGLSGLDRLAKRRNMDTEPAHLRAGIAGEDAAFFYLRRKGYTVAARRWSAGNVPGDVDLIAWQGSLLCIIEVKTRTAHDMTPAETAVDGHKRHVLRRLARAYIRHLPRSEPPQVRFDVISVYLVPGQEREFLHFENAFGWTERREE
jgi:putative endonuclease